ncbi:MAG TPA: SEC-C metal-binding domain-containing protein [Pyrinomonadaceae bacterium]|jgi:hypothetical protein
MGATTTRLDASIEAMREYFPEFSLAGLPLGTGPVAVWKGRVQPIQSTDGLEELLDDIYHERPVLMQAGGRIEHRPDCKVRHCHHDWMDKLSNPFVEYKLEVKYGGDETHPRAYVRHPVVPVPERQKHHLGDGALCAYPPWQGVWRWERDTVVQFMGHVTEWLVKWMVWEQAGVWIGPEMGHARGFLLQEVRFEQECHCGSGRQYRDCHLAEDQAHVRGVTEAILKKT